MSAEPSLTVVVAVESAAPLPALLERLAPARHPEVEFLLCRRASATCVVADLAANVRWLESAESSRIPDLWRDGFVAAHAPWVALLTTHCVPGPDWVGHLACIEVPDDVAGIGGHFRISRESTAADWALYLLRYVRFSRPVRANRVAHIAADNAVYRRDAVLDCSDLLPRGFWEPEYHARFAARGLRLCLSPDMPVTHVNHYTPAEFATQRFSHGRQYGRDRAQRLGNAARLVRLAAMPVVPALLFIKVMVSALRQGWTLAARPAVAFWLSYFCIHWALGEAAGTWDEIRGIPVR